jgi:GntR family transcriptional regulator
LETRTVIRQQAVVDQILDILYERIKSGTYQPNSKLPPENSLAQEFNVSRVTIRRALDVLVSRGMVFRMQGVGSFVSSVSQIANPLTDPILFQKIIANNGFEPGIRYIQSRQVYPDAALAERLRLNPQEDLIQLQKVFTADGEPVIYVVNSIPNWVLKGNLRRDVLKQPSISEPIMGFLENECKEALHFFISAVRPDSMGNCPIQTDDYTATTLAFVIDEIGHNKQEKPIMHSIQYYPGNRMKFELIRRRNAL